MALINRLPAYDGSQEALPNHLGFSLNFQEALKRGQKLAGHIAEALNGHAFVDTADVATLIERAKCLRNFSIKDTRTIAFVGDTGQGKPISFVHWNCLLIQ